jgi:hypothetical protein
LEKNIVEKTMGKIDAPSKIKIEEIIKNLAK